MIRTVNWDDDMRYRVLMGEVPEGVTYDNATVTRHKMIKKIEALSARNARIINVRLKIENRRTIY